MVCDNVLLLRWTPVLWITLLTHSVVCLLPAPVNVSVTSLNLEHTLTWSPGNNTPPHTRYRVQYSSNSSWSRVWACQELVSGESCDLTALLGDPLETYRLRLQAFNPAQKHHRDQSTWSKAKLFCPITDTVFGPPLIQVSGCGACLRLHIRPPSSRWQHLQENSNSSSPHPLLFYYKKLQAQLTRTRDNSQFSVVVESGENVIGYLEPGAEYCVTVVTVIPFVSHALPSQAHCTHTSPTPVNTVLVLVCVLCVLSLLGALVFFSALLYSGILLPIRKPLPHTLSSVSSLTPPAPWMSDELPAPALPLLDETRTHTHTHRTTHTHACPTSDTPHTHTHTQTVDKHGTEDDTGGHTLTHTPHNSANTHSGNTHTDTHKDNTQMDTHNNSTHIDTHSSQDATDGYGCLT